MNERSVSPDSQSPPVNIRRKLLHAALAAGLSSLLIGGFEYMLRAEKQNDYARDQLQLASQAGELRAQLLNELNSTLYLASGLVSYVQGKNGVISQRDIQPWLQNMTRQAGIIRAISLAPDNRISLIYPRAGNEAAIGLYYPDLPEQWPAVQQTILSRRPMLTGPLILKQGGNALIYRCPVFLADSRYWGMISTILNLPTLLAQTRQTAAQQKLSLTLVNQSSATAPGFLLGDRSTLDSATLRLELPVPGGHWLLGVSRTEELQTSASMSFLHALGWLLALALGAMAWLMLRSAERRNREQFALLESRQRFTRAFETAPQGMALITPEGRWIEVNVQLCKLLGRSAIELQQTDLWHMLVPAHQSKARQQLEEAYANPVQWEAAVLDNNSQSIDCQFSAAWLPGDTPSLILQCQDIRESKRLSKLKNEFVSTVSHELRTPLTSISGALDLLAGGALGDVPLLMRGMLDIARQNSQRLTLLINDLLDMEKLEAGKMSFELRSHSLQQQLQDAVASNASYAEPMGVTYQLREGTDVLVEVDSLRLQQVLSNLLSNAAKFAPRGSSVELGWEVAGERVKVSVHDQGAGIPLEFQQHIFSKFSQADGSDQRAIGGTGLGLAISRKLIEHMHGTIGFVSEPGSGTTFWFELPVQIAAPATQASPPHLLVVEDDDEIAELLKALLDANGYSSQRAASLDEARRQLTHEAITGLILDLHLPDGHGASLLREIRLTPATSRLPVIILSAFCSEGQRLLAGVPGQIDWLDKPLDAQQLLRLLDQHVKHAAQRPRILHVEDDADVRTVVAAQAASLADFDGAGSLAEAREALQQRQYQLLLLDIGLPDGNGLDLLHEVQCTQPELPVIILSTNEFSEGQLQVAQAAIAKSRYSQTELLNLLRRHLNNQSEKTDAQS